MDETKTLNVRPTPITQSGNGDGSSHNANGNAEVRIEVDSYTATAIGLDNLSVKDRCHHLMTLHRFASEQLNLMIPLLSDNPQPTPVSQAVVCEGPSQGMSELHEMIAEPTHELEIDEGVI